MANNSKDLIPSEDEVKNIIAQMMQVDPIQIPVVLMQIHVARLMLKVIDKLRKDLDQSIKELEDQIEH